MAPKRSCSEFAPVIVPVPTLKFPLMFKCPGPIAAFVFPRAREADIVAYPVVEIFPFESTWNLSPLPTVSKEAGEVSPIPTLPLARTFIPFVPPPVKIPARLRLPPVINFTDTSSIDPLKSVVGVNLRFPVPVAMIIWVCVAFVDMAVPFIPPTWGVTVPVVRFLTVNVTLYISPATADIFCSSAAVPPPLVWSASKFVVSCVQPDPQVQFVSGTVVNCVLLVFSVPTVELLATTAFPFTSSLLLGCMYPNPVFPPT